MADPIMVKLYKDFPRDQMTGQELLFILPDEIELKIGEHLESQRKSEVLRDPANNQIEAEAALVDASDEFAIWASNATEESQRVEYQRLSALLWTSHASDSPLGEEAKTALDAASGAYALRAIALRSEIDALAKQHGFSNVEVEKIFAWMTQPDFPVERNSPSRLLEQNNG